MFHVHLTFKIDLECFQLLPNSSKSSHYKNFAIKCLIKFRLMSRREIFLIIFCLFKLVSFFKALPFGNYSQQKLSKLLFTVPS